MIAIDTIEPTTPEKEYAFILQGGRYRFLVGSRHGIIRVFIEDENSKECYLRLSTDEYLKMVDNFLLLSKFFQDTQS
jgi:hypothetical protein